ncbi:MAG TPA: HIT family protein [Candidatus Thermoplasmatota archaeon]|nr:HIT family protein [Candidatus Thermoplasmatota archaeon]
MAAAPTSDPACVFCKIVARQIPARIVHEDEETLAFLDVHPLAEGHALVVPKAHRARLEDLNEDEARAFFATVVKVNRRSRKATGAPATTLAVNNGPEAGQEVPHLHLHVVPRVKGDGAGAIHALRWPRPTLAPARMDELTKEIRLLP